MNHRIEIHYNRNLGELETLLKAVERPGDFAVTGKLETPLPHITLDGIGQLAFPLLPAQAKEITSISEAAPFGRGEETIHDPSVRKVWQIPPDKVHLGGKWSDILDVILERVSQGLGCEGFRITAEFYKFLLYDEGSFFLAHRDTEKSEGMFGTLVVILPAHHRGGELILRHSDREVRFSTENIDISGIAFAAFYADCEHEVLPIKEGHRPCLIFNLIHTKKNTHSPLQAPLYVDETTKAAKLLKKAFSDSHAPQKLVWLLQHQYTPSALSFSHLKGKDAAIAKVLSEAAEQADCSLHLALVHIEETGIAEERYYPNRDRRRYSRFVDEDFEDDDDDDDDDFDEDFDIVEPTDETRYLDTWIKPDDSSQDYGKITLEDDELLPADALADAPPDEQMMHEATGNEGASYDRAYLRASLVIWPKEAFADILLQESSQHALPYFKDRIDAAKTDPELWPTVQNLAKRILDAWIRELPPQDSFSFLDFDDDADARATMLHLLTELGDPRCLQRFIEKVTALHFDGAETGALVAAYPLLPSGFSSTQFSKLIDNRWDHYPAECIKLVTQFANATIQQSDSTSPVAALFKKTISKLGKKHTKATKSYPRYLYRPTPKFENIDPSRYADLLDVMNTSGHPELCMQMAKTLGKNGTRFDPLQKLLPLLQMLHRKWGNTFPSDPAALHLWHSVAQQLLDRSEFPPPEPTDWKQEVTFEYYGDDGKELEAFARDPNARVHRFKVRKDRRQHLHRLIEHHNLDMTHVTERQGSPQTLVCTKTHWSYERKCKQYQSDIEAMATLLDLINTDDKAVQKMRDRLKNARARIENWKPMKTSSYNTPHP